MIYIVTYDIEDDKIRSKLSKVLKGVGQRVQKSVFECELSKRQLKILQKQIGRMLPKSGEDSNVRIYPLCMKCHKKASGVGRVTQSIYSKHYIVI
ncbi:CRISPR-associated endonuclease Cas2 [Maridesulfovibrio sp.]|uniref:CRISPR-associated endonuclease Cas2 n=1 Tax=unclassified Maridesulfovibrio TaxID=2794999 RepID=UPI003B00F3D1